MGDDVTDDVMGDVMSDTMNDVIFTFTVKQNYSSEKVKFFIYKEVILLNICASVQCDI